MFYHHTSAFENEYKSSTPVEVLSKIAFVLLNLLPTSSHFYNFKSHKEIGGITLAFVCHITFYNDYFADLKSVVVGPNFGNVCLT